MTTTVTPQPRRATPAPAPPTTPAPQPAEPEEAAVDDGDFEDLDVDPFATPEIVVTGPVEEDRDTVDLVAQRPDESGGGAGWVYFLIGFILGGLIGRASWGLQKRKGGRVFG